ncbi:MAG: hypothetical protein KAQ88_07445, partial [Hyphomicrobiaceae bacterium]|nr:hypothetical protein [Hyphomicrobiaceae bacterium]
FGLKYSGRKERYAVSGYVCGLRRVLGADAPRLEGTPQPNNHVAISTVATTIKPARQKRHVLHGSWACCGVFIGRLHSYR